jgi:hypothetical protein
MGVRPRSVSILGTLNIVYGGLCLLSNLGDLGVSLAGSMNERPQMGGAVSASAVMRAWSFAWPLIGLVAAGVLTASGVDLRRGKHRGLRLAVDYAVFYGIVTAIVSVGITLLFVSVPLFEAYQRNRRPDQLAEAISRSIFILLEVGPSAIYSVVLLVVLRRPAVAASLS